MLVFTVTSLNGIDKMAKKVATPHLFLLQETEKHYSKFQRMIGLKRCLSAAQRLRPTTEPDPLEMALRKELGAGETAAITLAYKSHADLVILDDLQARLVACAMGLRITGTLGVLLAANHKSLLPDIVPAIQKLQQCGFRISDTLLQKMSDLANHNNQ